MDSTAPPTAPRLAPLTGTKDSLPALSATRWQVMSTLRALYSSWGYAPVEVPAIEPYDPTHPAAARAFKLVDGSDVLMLRADFTPSISRLIQAQEAGLRPTAAIKAGSPQLISPEVASSIDKPPNEGNAFVDDLQSTGVYRYQYSGALWQAHTPTIINPREFTQIGLELIGSASTRADVELIHLARESVRAVGLVPRVDLGNPGLIRKLLDLAGIPKADQERVATTIDRKDVAGLSSLLEPYTLAPDLRNALLATPDLYGGVDVLDRAHKLMPWPDVADDVRHFEAVIAEFEDVSELHIDLAMARRLDYYTGITFRAYTTESAQPLLGGGRYDGALLPHAAGFALGLERVVTVLPHVYAEAPLVVSNDDVAARRLRAAGYSVSRALATSPTSLRAEAVVMDVPFVLMNGQLEAVKELTPELENLQHALQVSLNADTPDENTTASI
ncbi:MAG: ATP phosphoribosyltransferase regulatory subunit [Deinococcota bacterium]